MEDYTKRLADDTFAIYLFHGIYWRKDWKLRNTSGKHIEMKRFKRIVRDLRFAGEPVSMDSIIRGNIPPRAFAITFDDGFASAYWLGASYLDEIDVPATFYVTSDFVQRPSLSWVDIIEQCAEAVSLHPDALSGIKTFGKLSGYDQYLIARFASGLMADAIPSPQLDTMMTPSMVCELAAHPLFTVGGHSKTHRNLEYLSIEDMIAEIRESTEWITDVIGKYSPHYSYPEGMLGCNTEDIVCTLKRHGVKCCPTAQDGVNHEGDDLFALRRIMVV